MNRFRHVVVVSVVLAGLSASGQDAAKESVAPPAAVAETPESLYKRALELERIEKVAQAAEAFEAFLKAYPDHSQRYDAHYRLGTCYDSMGKVDEAISNLETAVENTSQRFRNRPDALFLLGRLLGDAKEYKKAIPVLSRLLSEGAGLYEDEALNMVGGYYALLGEYEEAAARFNILKRRPNSKFAERAAHKLALVWLQAGDMEQAVAAVSDLAVQFPSNQEARGLMLRIADEFRAQKMWDKALSICEQIRTSFPESREAKASAYVVGMCYRDRKEYDKAVQSFEAMGRDPASIKSGLAAEAMVKAADIYYADLHDTEKAMDRYTEAARLAREYSDEERQAKILELCYFRLAEHYFALQKWSVALEFYSLLREVGTEINILPRILKCQSELGITQDPWEQSEQELEFLRKKIAENPGTFIAAEGEVFIADHELERYLASGRQIEGLKKVQGLYEGILKRYPQSVLSQYHLESYLHVQLGRVHASLFGANREADVESDEWKPAVAEFQKAIDGDPETPYLRDALDFIARTADAAGQTQLAFETYRKLYELVGEEVAAGGAVEQAREDMTDYLRSMLTRAEAGSSIEDALQLATRVIEEQGQDSDAGRYAMFYIGELHYLRKDFSAAAKAFKEFVKIYGPPQDESGNLVEKPWKVQRPDAKTEQVFEAAVRIAHSWYLQGHTQNMLAAYRWIVENMSEGNKYMAEAQYWLTMELAKGKKAEDRDTKIAFARAMWTGVVARVFFDHEDYDAGTVTKDPQSRKDTTKEPVLYPWVRDWDMQKYVKPAIIKVGETCSEVGEHVFAAKAFETYLDLYPEPKPVRNQPPPPPDDYRGIARYALGREYIELRETDKLVDVYKPYIGELRDDPFRVSALRLLGFHATTGEDQFYGAEAYATLLDEYGRVELDKEGEPVPLPASERIRKDSYGWDGIRRPPPENLDLSQVRYALGFLYWKNEDWAACVRTLTPFVGDPDLRESPHRAKSLYMLGQSHYRLRDYANGTDVLGYLIDAHPGFEALQEVYVKTAWGLVELKKWDVIEALYRKFVAAFPQSLNRPHMDLYAAIAKLYGGDAEQGVAQLGNLAKSETYEDVKADALYYLGIHEMPTKSAAADEEEAKMMAKQYQKALSRLDASIELYPRARTCLAAAKCLMGLGEWNRARIQLDRTIRDFPDVRKPTVDEATGLLPVVLKELAKGGAKE